jgi:hypothetical protein
MTPRKYNNPPPARSEGTKAPAPHDSSAPGVLNPADEVVVLVGQRIPRRWLHVTFALAPATDPAQAALAVAWFAARVRAIDKRLQLTVARERSAATAGELMLAFAPRGWGTLEIGWLEEVKPKVRELAAEFDGAEVRAVEVISE